MGKGAKAAVLLVLILAIFFLVPFVSVSGSTNFLVVSASSTVYESLGLSVLGCGGYYYTASSSVLGQSSGSSGYGFSCNAQAGS